MTFTWFSVAVLAVLATFVAFGAVRGARTGFTKTFISLAALAASLVVSLVISPYVSQIFGSMLLGLVQPLYTMMFPPSAYMDLLITAVLTALISSFFFLILMWVLKKWFAMLFKMVYRSAEKNGSAFPTENAPAYERRPKVWGAAVGALSGLLVTITILAPVTGSLRLAGKIVDIVDKADPNFFALEEARREVNNFKKYTNDSVSMMLYSMGGEFIYSSAASVSVNGETIYAVKEVESIEVLVEDFIALFPVLVAPETAAPEHSAAIDDLCVHMDDSQIIDLLMAEFLPQASSAWLRGEVFMMIPKPNVNSLIEPALDGLLQICADSDVYTVKDNATSLLRIYSIILKSGILQSGDDFDSVIRCIQSSDLLAKLEAEIDKNPNMGIVKTYTAEIAMRALASEIYGANAGNIPLENYQVLTEKLAEAMGTINNKGYGTNEEKISAMTSYAQEYLGDYGITVPVSLAEPIAEIMLSKVGSSGEVSAESIQDFLKSYLSN